MGCCTPAGPWGPLCSVDSKGARFSPLRLCWENLYSFERPLEKVNDVSGSIEMCYTGLNPRLYSQDLAPRFAIEKLNLFPLAWDATLITT